MREQNDRIPKDRIRKRSDLISWRSIWNRLSTNHWGNPFCPISDIHSDDRGPRADQFNINRSWIEYRLTVGITGTAGFLYGFVLIIYYMLGGSP